MKLINADDLMKVIRDTYNCVIYSTTFMSTHPDDEPDMICVAVRFSLRDHGSYPLKMYDRSARTTFFMTGMKRMKKG